MISIGRSLFASHRATYLSVLVTLVFGATIFSTSLSVYLAAGADDGLSSSSFANADAAYAARVALEDARSFLMLTMIVVTVILVFLTASTIAYAVGECGRELALLRLIGGSPRHLRRVVLWQGVLLGGVGGTLGAVLGVLLAPPFRGLLVALGLAPEEFRVGIHLAAPVTTLLVIVTTSLVGALTPARRTARLDPLDAVSESQVPRKTISRSRLALGLCLGTATGGLLVMPLSVGDFQTITLLISICAIGSLTALAPVVVPPLAKVFGRIAEVFSPAVGELARNHASWSASRTAMLATPIILLIGIAGGLFMIAQTALAAQTVGFGQSVNADIVVVPDPDHPVTEHQLSVVQDMTDVEVASMLATSTAWQKAGDSTDVGVWVGWADFETLAAVIDLDVVHGSLSEVSGTVVATTDTDLSPGDHLDLLSPGGEQVAVTIGAVVQENDVLLQDVIFAWDSYPELADGARQRLWGAVAAGADVAAVLDDIGTELPMATVQSKADWMETGRAERSSEQMTGLMAMLGAGALLAIVALVQTVLTGQRERQRDYALLASLGASRRQLSFAALVETGVVLTVGLVLTAAVLASTAVRLARMLAYSNIDASPALPVGALLVMTAACVTAAIGATHSGARRAMGSASG